MRERGNLLARPCPGSLGSLGSLRRSPRVSVRRFHRMPPCDVGKQALVDFTVPDSSTKVVEVTDHHRREVEVELATQRRADPEAVGYARREEDERAGRARDLAVV